MQAINKAKEQFRLKEKEEYEAFQKKENHFFIKSDGTYEKIYFHDILYIKGLQNYVVAHTVKARYTTLLTLKKWEENLDSANFIRGI